MFKRGLHCQYLSDSVDASFDPSMEAHTGLGYGRHRLGLVAFNGGSQQSPIPGLINTGLTLLEPESVMEELSINGVVTHGGSDGLQWAQTDDLLLLAIQVKDVPGELEQSTQQLYTRLLDEMKSRGFLYMVRVWNYLANINALDHSEERYRQFCVGRFEAFKRFDIQEKDFPSACALGHFGGDTVVYLLASKERPMHFENPQQISAYHYPEQYGPRSPSFARATLFDVASDSAKLFVSGTASVIGHVTQHPDDIQGQLEVTLDNIERLLVHVRESQPALPTLTAEVLKVYLRRPEDLALVKAGVAERFGAIPTIFVAADVCRQDLLVEVDGVWQLQC